MLDVFFSPSYVGSIFAFDTTRKSQWIVDSLLDDPIPEVELHEPRSLTAGELTEAHDVNYVRAIETGEPAALAESQGFEWDPGLWRMVSNSNGGAVDAAVTALKAGISGSLSSGLHHARRDHGAGFCTFNGLAVAARRALDSGARSVLILDLDAHCGGGTHSFIAEDPRIRQIDVSVSSFDVYTPAERTTLDLVASADTYLPTIVRRLEEIDARAPRFDLCLYNAGMDPHEDCEVGGLAGIDEHILSKREEMVFQWSRARNTPIAFVLAGGYIGPRLDKPMLVKLHRLTLSAAARHLVDDR